MIDFITTRCRDKMDIHSVPAMSGSNCWTDHQMLRSNVAFRIRQQRNSQGRSKPTKLNRVKLSTISYRESFEQEMDSACSRPVRGEGKLNTRRGMSSSGAGTSRRTHLKHILASQTEKYQDWFDPNDQEPQTYEQKRPSTVESVANQEQ